MLKKSGRILFGLVLVAIFAGHAAAWYRLPLLSELEAILVDVRIRAVTPYVADDRIVIVDIDEKSLREKARGGEGHWPWPRDRLALLVTDLFHKYQVSLVAMDLLLSEKDESSGLQVLEGLAEKELKHIPEFSLALQPLRARLSYDQLFAQSLQTGTVILGFAFHNDEASTHTPLPRGIDPTTLGLPQMRAQSYPSFIAPLPEFQKQAAGLGHLNPLRDPDGVTRRVPMLVENQGRYYPSLSLAVIQAVMGIPQLGAVTSSYGNNQLRVEALTVGPVEIPVDAALNAWVPFQGAARSFKYVSAAAILQGRTPKEVLQNRIVLIGTSATGLSDLVTTPLGVSFPGVEVHANLITGMLDGRIVLTPAYAQGAEMLCLLTLGLLMVIAGTWLRPFQALLLGLLALLGLIATNIALLQIKHMMLPLAAPAVCLMSVFVCQMVYGYFIESRGRRQISNLFSYYVPPELVQKMAENPGAFSMAPLQREMTVLFSDVRGFTSIAEKLSPHDLADLINAYLSAMSQVIREEHHGTLDKYIGDAIMAFWGAPVTDAAHAENAVLAALQMQQVAQRLREEFLTKGWPELRIGIGLNSGQMRVGDMGSNIRKAYTAMGDEVNLGARLEGLTKIYGVDILMGENTHNLLRAWVSREVDSVRVKGKHKPIAIYEPLCPVGVASDALDQELQQWHQALSAYRSQRWLLAQNLLESLLSAHPESALYALYQKRISQFLDSPPAPDWDGATNFELK